MHTLVWILLVWGAQPAPESVGDVVAVYSSEKLCVAAGVDKTTGAHQAGDHYRCDSAPLDPAHGQAHDARDYRSIPKQ